MTDPGQFELLATAVLRAADPDCAGIIHAGVNDKGETISAPFDGFGVLTHLTPPKIVFVAHTTADRTRLRRKLLSGDDAELKKAERELARFRTRLPVANAKIVLCLNEPMGREQPLYLDMATRANDPPTMSAVPPAIRRKVWILFTHSRPNRTSSMNS